MRRRFWQRVIVLVVLAFAFSLVAEVIPSPAKPDLGDTLLRLAITAAWVVVAIVLLRGLRHIGLESLREEPPERRPVVHLGIQLLLAFLVLVSALVITSAWRFSFAGLALGGAFTGVVVGLAAQSTLGNAIAGAMLLALRPFRVGEWASLHVAGWDCSGRVEEINFFYTVLRDGGIRRVVPNSLVASSPANVTETQSEPSQTITLPYRVPPEQALNILQPFRSAEVVDLRVDSYALRVEWQGEHVEARLAAIASLLTGA